MNLLRAASIDWRSPGARAFDWGAGVVCAVAGAAWVAHGWPDPSTGAWITLGAGLLQLACAPFNLAARFDDKVKGLLLRRKR